MHMEIEYDFNEMAQLVGLAVTVLQGCHGQGKIPGKCKIEGHAV